MAFGGGGSKKGEIDRVSSESKAMIRQLINQQSQAATRGTQAMSQDLELLRQQMFTQNAQTASLQQIQNQALTAQEKLAQQYQGGLQQQLGLLKQQNSLLSQQGQQQSAYYASARQFQNEQRTLQNQQLAQAQKEKQYTSLLESNERRMAGNTANRLRLQINRRRAINRLGQGRYSSRV